MSKMLSILIPTLPSRIDVYAKLMRKLKKQVNINQLHNQVQILTYGDSKEVTVGEKRNWLLERAVGKYVVFLDDDDDIATQYLIKLLRGCANDCDVVTFRGEYHENGQFHSDFIISRMVRMAHEHKGVLHRKPNHICPVKREIALKAKFPHQQVSEDSEYSERINKHIRDEFHLPDKLYFYHFDSHKTQTQNQVSQAYD